VKKRYVALLEPTHEKTFPRRGQIALPLRPDPLNRPYQVVDELNGKRAVTEYEFLSDDRVLLYPQTGRTHQLRVHCAHLKGLNRPILGDNLYGRQPADRLYLHAEAISFVHPLTGQPLHLESKAPF
jgi:tRNA pseudouridine32 synthase/23S rRNA pseudouridine746 synthase